MPTCGRSASEFLLVNFSAAMPAQPVIVPAAPPTNSAVLRVGIAIPTENPTIPTRIAQPIMNLYLLFTGTTLSANVARFDSDAPIF
jgi:hypothetical protein